MISCFNLCQVFATQKSGIYGPLSKVDHENRSTANIQILYSKRYSTSQIQIYQATWAQHTKQGKTNIKVIILLQILQSLHSYSTYRSITARQNSTSSIHFQNTNTFTSKQHKFVQGPLRECCSIQSGASRLPYYCAPLVCVSDVMELLAVWWHTKPKTKKKSRCLKVGLGISRMNADSQWNPVYNVFHRNFCCGNEMISR